MRVVDNKRTKCVEVQDSSMVDICPECKNEYKRIASHWSCGTCNHPSFSDHQREIVTGVLMGDGWIGGSGSGNPRIKCQMTTKKYLGYIDNEFGIFGNGVSLRMTGEENAEKLEESGFSEVGCPENYSDIYRWSSMRHPELQEFANWYSSGKKVWPDSIRLTPTVLKHWYCGDGHWDNSELNNHIRIEMSNEVNNQNKVSLLFKQADLPSPSNYAVYQKGGSNLNCGAQFTSDQSKELWEYMGDPVPGFEYKWPERFK